MKITKAKELYTLNITVKQQKEVLEALIDEVSYEINNGILPAEKTIVVIETVTAKPFKNYLTELVKNKYEKLIE